MQSSILPLNEIIKLNTRLFINSLEGVNDKIAKTRVNDKTNSVYFQKGLLLIILVQGKFKNGRNNLS
jgi:hypothetical protein